MTEGMFVATQNLVLVTGRHCLLITTLYAYPSALLLQRIFNRIGTEGAYNVTTIM